MTNDNPDPRRTKRGRSEDQLNTGRSIDHLTDKVTEVVRSLEHDVVQETLKRMNEDGLGQLESQDRKYRMDFFAARPPKFNGVMDYATVNNWFLDMEHVFSICDIQDDIKKVVCASYMLRGQALYWWNHKKASSDPVTMKDLEWDEFKDCILNEFSPAPLVDKLKQEYDNLKQGRDMTVLEYTIKFKNLARFSFVDDATVDQISKYISGLLPEILGLVTCRYSTQLKKVKRMDQVVEMALEMENQLMKTKT
ncbi:zinc finger, CCHC-type, retrotransposon gag domain protein [Tanacetum coccineum]